MNEDRRRAPKSRAVLVSQLLSALGASSRQNLSPVGSGHSFPEAVFFFPVDLLRLIRSFHFSSSSRQVFPVLPCPILRPGLLPIFPYINRAKPCVLILYRIRAPFVKCLKQNFNTAAGKSGKTSKILSLYNMVFPKTGRRAGKNPSSPIQSADFAPDCLKKSRDFAIIYG